MTTSSPLETLLRHLTDRPDATFRPGQREAIEHLVESRGRVLVVQRTGWGKSAVYFLATRLIRDRGGGPTLLISPLLALMRNQLLMAQAIRISAHRIDSSNPESWPETTRALATGDVDLLLISPERLNNPSFRQEALPLLASSLGMLVVDEAHCISDWGHDFRPDYRRIRRILQLLPDGVPVLCTTATANERVMGDMVDQLGDLAIIRGPLDRPSLRLAVVDLPSRAARLAWLAEVIPTMSGSGIVYCLTVDDTEQVATWLRSRGIDAASYSGKHENEVRVNAEQALLTNELKVLVATSALGMGFDKPDLSFVIHYQSPGSPIAYYQQVGRAGRALDQAEGVLLRGHEDRRIQDYFIETAFPSEQDARRIVELLETDGGALTIREIEQHVNVRHSRLEAMLKVLEVEGAVERVGGRWRRTLAPWSYDAGRVAKVTALRRHEQDVMQEYGTTGECRMDVLLRELDDDVGPPCGRCDNCLGTTGPPELDGATVAAARQFLRSGYVGFEPRLQWLPSSAGPGRRIRVDRRVETGRALSRYGDGGWGDLVREAKYCQHHAPDELVCAAVDCIRSWNPHPTPAWVTAVPSSADDGFVCDFAARLSSALDLPFRNMLRRARPGRPQKEMENGVQQMCNVRGAFAVDGRADPRPVLLVDDIVDSRWTLTTVGFELREAGCGPVHPFVLAKAVSK